MCLPVELSLRCNEFSSFAVCVHLEVCMHAFEPGPSHRYDFAPCMIHAWFMRTTGECQTYAIVYQ